MPAPPSGLAHGWSGQRSSSRSRRHNSNGMPTLPIGGLGRLKFKNPAAPAVQREAEKEWGR